MDIDKYEYMITNERKVKFDRLSKLLVDNNKKFNLTSICEQNEIVIKHFLDSVLGESFIKKGAFVAEIGSGGGFPSLPLKIVRDDLKMTLIESTGKKCNYLKEAVKELCLDCMQVVCGRAEELAKDEKFRERYDVSIARAVARLNTLCEYCMPFVKEGGKFIAYKGDCDQEVSEAEKAVKVLGGRIQNIEKYELPDGEKRSLVIIEKIYPTPLKYPRGQGRERKSPIV